MADKEPEPTEGGGSGEKYTLNSHGIPEFAAIDLPPAPEKMSEFDTSGPRLMISKIINENFKSYAGVQSLGPFHKSFSAIVGPNGSGKSNVIDSMLFVFGYRASKIRSKKLSVLIHQSEKLRNLTSCTVTVYFQNIIDTGEGDDDYTVVPNSKFSVSRTAFKDNSSYYRVNDKKTTYKEVAILLRASGIDLDHNRFLILQGEVEQIAMMKPKAPSEHEEGMLEFLEDIIGSGRFKVPIDLLSGRVEILNELRTEKLNRVKAVEKEKDDLEEVKDEAVEFLTIENDIASKKNCMFQKYIVNIAELEKKAQEKIADVKESAKEAEEKINAIAEERKAKNKEYKKLYKQYELLMADGDTKKEQFNQFEQQDVRCREDLKHTKAKGKKLDKQLEQEKKKLEELLQIPAKTESELAGLQKKLEKMDVEKRKEEEKLAEVMASLQTETQGLQAEKDEKETELAKLQETVTATKSKYNVGQAELDLYMSNQSKEQAKLRDTQKNLDTAQATLKDRKSAVADLKKKIPDTETALGKAQRDLESAKNSESLASNQVRQLRVKVEEARSSLQMSRSRGNVLDALLQLKNSGRLPGIYGRLGDLGAIDEKYDVAISTGCGPLDNILVDTIDTAQKCVDFLKQSNIGSATFIGLDKMERWKEYCSRKIQTPENVPRLFDLVKVDNPEVLPAFYFAMRDTLVAKDMDQATRIAYGSKRYRVVTLGGGLIDLSGTMSGGGTRVSKGRMGSKVIHAADPSQLQDLENEMTKATNESAQCRSTHHKLEDAVHKMEASVREMKHALDKFSMEIQTLTGQVNLLTKQMGEQEQCVKAAAPDKKQLQQLEKSVVAFKKEYDMAHAAANAVEEEVHQIHKQIMDVGGTKLKAAESRLNLIQTQIDQVTGHITKAKVAIKTAQRNATKSESKVESLAEEREEARVALEKLEAEFKKLEEEATKVMNEYQKAQDDMKGMEGNLEEVKSAVGKLEEQDQALQKDMIEVRHLLEKHDTNIKEHQMKLKHWKKELGKLSLHKIDMDETASVLTQLPSLSEEELESVDTEDVKYQITLLEEKLGEMKPNMAAIAEYRKKEEMYLKRVGELDQITELRDAQRQRHDDLRKERLEDFINGFTVITNKLKEMYQMITLGGDAELELVDSLDPFSEGIVFSVRPPKKSWKNISNLSGGEKTLSSLALVFALHHYKPTPLYVMDEIDAALDFKNVSIVANYIKERTKNAQFIIISLRNNMFELADLLIGIYKTYDCTKSVAINPTRISMPLQPMDINQTTVI